MSDELDLKSIWLSPQVGAALDKSAEKKPAAAARDIASVKEQVIKDAAKDAEKADSAKASAEGGSDMYGGLEGLLSDRKAAHEKLIDSYSNVEIVDIGADLPMYKIKLPNLTVADQSVIESVQKIAVKIIDIRKESLNSRTRKQNLRDQVYEMITKTRSINISEIKMRAYADIISREMGGYGLLDYALDDDQLEELMVVPPKRDVYVFHRKHGMLLTNLVLESNEYVSNIIERIARDVSRRIDINNPLLDARLPWGDRVNATLPPASVDGPTLTIRKFREDPYTIVSLIKFGTISPKVAAFLWVAVEGLGSFPANILISGGTSSGKTTFLNCLAMFVRPTERVLTIEDTAELKLPLKHWIRMETRPPSIEGTGEITMDILLKNSLRMRPDRIIVGEVRHSEAFTLFTAMNTGHQGSMGTIHANNSNETLVRLMSPPMSVPEQMATALDLIVSLNKINVPKVGMKRRVTEIAEVTGVDKPETHILYEWSAEADAMSPLDTNSNLLKKIRKLSGRSAKSIEDEISIREELLTEAANKGITEIKDFAVFIQKYYESR